ncbi:hypothetical protein REPUB_Repub02eG0031500 [Reevesia pubescens]
MEVRGSQERDIKTPGSSGFGHQSPGGVERRRDGNPNGTAVLTCTQTLDHVHRAQRQQQSLGQGRSPHPDRVSGAAVAPISVSSNTKPTSNIRYRECLKNHAASIGGSVYDGCGEFMPSGEEGTLEALKCAACDCHRNFHRKEVDGETQFGGNSNRRSLILNPLQLPPPLPSPTMLHHHHQKYSVHASPSSAMVAPMNVAFGSGGGGGTESSSEDLNVFQSNAEGMPPPPPYVLSKKRFRTKFTQEQKDKMLELAEKLGWRINKQDEEEVQKFCAESGVKRQVFKVWMHNNKNVKKQPQE